MSVKENSNRVAAIVLRSNLKKMADEGSFAVPGVTIEN
jgi:hypothetical protein